MPGITFFPKFRFGKTVIPFFIIAMPDRIKRQRFIFLSLLLLALFVFPLISLADKPVRIGGIPLLFVYFFTVWLLAIGLLYRYAEKNNQPPGPFS